MTVRTIGDRILSGNVAAPLFCIVAVAANQSLFRLGALPLHWAALLVATVAIAAVTAPDIRLGAVARARLHGWNVLLGLLIVAPLIVTFSLGWNRDFPFSGDHYFHVGQAYRLAFWWLSLPASPVVRVPSMEDVQALLHRPAALALSRAMLLVVLAGTGVALYRWNRIAALVVATLAALVWGLCEQSIFLRYPAGGYFIAMPFLGPAILLHNVELAGRAANVAAPVLWLFVLRPWLIGRWPDLGVLPFALLLFWHQEVIYYFDTVYLEPWAITFCLLAVEILLARGSRGAPRACLLIGAAAAVKEAAILVLPLFWLAGAPWRKSWNEVFALSGAALAAGFPFVLYFAARRSVAAEIEIEGARGFQFELPLDQIGSYAQEFAHRMQAAFPLGSGALFLAALVAVIAMMVRLPSRRLQIACVTVAGVGLVLFFIVDERSLQWIGYFRFFLAPLPFLAAGALALGYALRRDAALMAGVVALALQAPSAWSAIAKAAGPVTGRNFVENYDAPIVFPIKSLLAEARGKGVLPRNATVSANSADTSMRAIPGLPVTYNPPGPPDCECSKEHLHVMALFVRYANLDAPFAQTLQSGAFGPPVERDRLWRSGLAQRPLCVAALKRTCGHVLERLEEGELVAVLGTFH